jgi:arsenate reductase
MKAYSAGSQPKGEVHPLSISALQRALVFPPMASAANPAMPRRAGTGLRHHRLRQGRWRSRPWFFDQQKAHWGLSDPSDLHGSAAELDAAFDNTLEQIKRRLKAFIALPSTKWMPPSSRSSWPASERSDV